MQEFDLIRNKRRYIMFDKNTINSVLKIQDFFQRYKLVYDESLRKEFVYYDTDTKDLYKSNVALYKSFIQGTCRLSMVKERSLNKDKKPIQTIVLVSKKNCQITIDPADKVLDHTEFLRNSFKDMFLTGLMFDPDYLMRRIQPEYVIITNSKEYKALSGSGLKATYAFDNDSYLNLNNNRKVEANILTIYQHSNKETDEEFEDMCSKLERYCKELQPTFESRIQIARRLTKDIDYEKIKELKAKQLQTEEEQNEEELS